MAPKRKHGDEILAEQPEIIEATDGQTKRPRTEQTPNRTRKATRNGTLDSAFIKTGRKVLANALDVRLWGWIHDVENDLITIEHLRRACGFAGHPQQPICPPVSSKALLAKGTALHGSRSRKPKPPSDVEVIEIEDSDGEVERHICSKKNCRFNPQCLNHLGQDKWNDVEVAKEAYMRGAGLGYDPASDLRDPNLPVGLKNLGATCYANAFLQVWFQDLAFRSGVYRCLPSTSDSDPEKLEHSPIYQLQLTFAALQLSRQRVFDPIRLVDSLQLQKSEQQDAQEFSKLFLSLLANEFEKQSEPSLRSLVSDQFEGRSVYGTMCLKCQSKSERESPFLELEITLEPQCNLEDRIGAILASERLSGDNKYHCSNCNSLQNACRYTRLKSLPPVLHFSIMRFVFDVETLTRKKSKQVISFPTVLDMTEYLDMGDFMNEAGNPDSDGLDELDFDWAPKPAKPASQSREVYDLTGVLLHKGASAYHGHYESHVLDVTNSTWYDFNDEEVTVSERRPTDKAARRTSKLAYMLIYSRREGNPRTNTSCTESSLSSSTSQSHATAISPTQLEPSARLKEEVERLNQAHKVACDEYDAKRKLLEADFQRVKEQKDQVFNTWRVKTHDELSMVVDQSVLESWVAQGMTASSSHGSGDSSPSNTKTEDPMHFREDQPSTSYLGTPQSTMREPSSSDSDATLLESPLPSQPTFSNSAIVCHHGGLSPGAAIHSKRISMEAYARIVRGTQCRFEPEITSEQICQECVTILRAEKLYPLRHREHVQRFQELQGDEESLQHPGRGYWLSKSWLKDWRLNKPSMRSMATNGHGDPSPDTPPWKEEVTCEHGGLSVRSLQRMLITDAAYEFLKTIFPSWETKPVGSAECEICKEHVEEKLVIDNIKRDVAEAEKAKLKALLERRRLYKVEDLELGEEYFLVASSSLLRWKRFIKNPIKELPPNDLGTRQFICQHSLLKLDPHDITDISRALVPRSEFEVLAGIYPQDLIRISATRGLDDPWTLMLNLDVCEPCTHATKIDYIKTDLDIRVLLPTDPNPSTSSYFRKPSIGPNAGPSDVFKSDKLDTLNPFSASLAKTTSTRRSGRIAQQTSERPTHRIKVNKTDTLRCIKEKIAVKTDIQPYCQQIFHLGRDISNIQDEVQAGDLGITINDMLEVKDRSLDDNDTFWSTDAGAAEGRKVPVPEEGRGFHGTLLSGAPPAHPPKPQQTEDHPPEDKDLQMEVDQQEPAARDKQLGIISAESQDVPMSEPSETGVHDVDEMTNGPACPACTFINPDGVSCCTICDTPFI